MYLYFLGEGGGLGGGCWLGVESCASHIINALTHVSYSIFR